MHREAQLLHAVGVHSRRAVLVVVVIVFVLFLVFFLVFLRAVRMHHARAVGVIAVVGLNF